MNYENQKRDELFQCLIDFGWKQIRKTGLRPEVCMYEFVKEDCILRFNTNKSGLICITYIRSNEYEDEVEINPETESWSALGWDIDDSKVDIFVKKSIEVRF